MSWLQYQDYFAHKTYIVLKVRDNAEQHVKSTFKFTIFCSLETKYEIKNMYPRFLRTTRDQLILNNSYVTMSSNYFTIMANRRFLQLIGITAKTKLEQMSISCHLKPSDASFPTAIIV